MPCLGITKLWGSNNPFQFKLTVIQKGAMLGRHTDKICFLHKMQTSVTASQHCTGLIQEGQKKKKSSNAIWGQTGGMQTRDNFQYSHHKIKTHFSSLSQDNTVEIYAIYAIYSRWEQRQTNLPEQTRLSWFSPAPEEQRRKHLLLHLKTCFLW